MKRASAVVVAVLAALPCVAVLSGVAGARPVAGTPLGVAATSLTQDGFALVWTLTATSRFAPIALAASGRSVCLHVGTRRLFPRSSLCLGGRRRAQVWLTEPGRRAVLVPATIRRPGGRGVTVSFPVRTVEPRYAALRWQVSSTVSARTCTTGCSVSVPARPALLRLHPPKLAGCVASGPAYVTDGPTGRREIALTFDDGPWYDTPQFLDILERYHVPATFFQVGRQISTYGGAVDRRMLADGDMIGDHTWSHPVVARGGRFAAQQISQAVTAIRNLTGFTPCLFRAPYGATSPALVAEARRMGFTTIQWNIDPRDWARPGVSAIVNNVLANARNGAIIDQHDGGGNRAQTLAALPREIAGLRKRGFAFVTVTQMLGQKLIWR